MSYNVIVAPRAEKDLKLLLENEPKAYSKALNLSASFMSILAQARVSQSPCREIVWGNGAVESARGIVWSMKSKIQML